jgi:hypothetical protein
MPPTFIFFLLGPTVIIAVFCFVAACVAWQIRKVRGHFLGRSYAVATSRDFFADASMLFSLLIFVGAAVLAWDNWPAYKILIILNVINPASLFLIAFAIRETTRRMSARRQTMLNNGATPSP